MTNTKKDTVKINNKEFNIADLSKEAREQLTNLRVCEVEINRLKAQLAITQTASNAYLKALTELLPVQAQ